MQIAERFERRSVPFITISVCGSIHPDCLAEGSRYGATTACESLLSTTGTISNVTPKPRHCRTHSWNNLGRRTALAGSNEQSLALPSYRAIPAHQAENAFPQSVVNWHHIVVAESFDKHEQHLETHLSQNLFEIISTDTRTDSLVAKRLDGFFTNQSISRISVQREGLLLYFSRTKLKP
jgi:hypothetical protein